MRGPSSIKDEIIFQRIVDYFELKGKGTSCNKNRISALFHAIRDGEFDVVRMKDGAGFWHEKGYTMKDDEHNA